MNLNDFLEKWGRTMFEAPLAAIQVQEPPELAEIRLALLDEAMAKSYRSGGRKVFPFDLLRVELSGVEQNRYSVFTGRFFRKYLEQEVCEALRSAGCRFPDDLRVEVQATVGLPPRGGKWLSVAAASRDRTPAPARGRLVVKEGAANVEELHLDKARINIGRGMDVYRWEGICRRNDLAFLEENPVSRTVSREHAHILFDRAAGEYRLFNDRWYSRESSRPGECGTWIVRDGMSLEVHRNARGTRLESGDEIHFGRAVVMFEVETS